MRILACFKIVRDLENVIDKDWDSAQDAGFRIDYTKKLINDADQGALEAALRMKDQKPGAELCAVTVNDDAVDSFFTGLFAVGFDTCAQVRPGEDLTYRPMETAKLLAEYAEQTGPYDVILTGAQAPPGDSRQVPYAVSEFLGTRCLDRVREVVPEEDGVRVYRQTQEREEVYGADCPLLIVMEDARYSYLRIPTLRERMKASGKKAQQITGIPDGMREPVILGFRPAREKRNCRFLEKDALDELFPLLLSSESGVDAQ